MWPLESHFKLSSVSRDVMALENKQLSKQRQVTIFSFYVNSRDSFSFENLLKINRKFFLVFTLISSQVRDLAGRVQVYYLAI